MKENYIHRIGRAGRFGRKGVTINLISKEESRARDEIQQHFKITMEEMPPDVSNISL